MRAIVWKMLHRKCTKSENLSHGGFDENDVGNFWQLREGLTNSPYYFSNRNFLRGERSVVLDSCQAIEP